MKRPALFMSETSDTEQSYSKEIVDDLKREIVESLIGWNFIDLTESEKASKQGIRYVNDLWDRGILDSDLARFLLAVFTEDLVSARVLGMTERFARSAQAPGHASRFLSGIIP